MGVDAHYAACCLKRAFVFTVSMQDIQYHLTKKLEPRLIGKMLYLKNTMIFMIFFQRQTQIFSFYIKSMILRFK